MAEQANQLNVNSGAPEAAAVAPAETHPASQFEVASYSLVGSLGKGAYGHVWRGYCTRTERYVAIKRTTTLRETPVLAIRMLREAKILRHLRGHDDIIRCHGFLTPPYPGSFLDTLMVFDVMPRSLYQILVKKPILKPREVNALMFQLVRGVRFMHKSGVMHRDLKPENLLVDPETGNLKICDFGLSRVAFKPTTFVNWPDMQLWTSKVVTRWYRPPELLMMETGKTFYNSAIDVWSMGCIFGEMMLGKPLFPGEDDEDMMCRILQFTGIPSEDAYLRITSESAREVILSYQGGVHADWFSLFRPETDKKALDLVKRMLNFDPQQRPSAEELLEDEYFKVLLRREGYGKAHVSIDQEEFAFENLAGLEPELEIEKLYHELMLELERSRDVTEGNTHIEIRQSRSRAIIHAMKGSVPNHGIEGGTEGNLPSPGPPAAVYGRISAVATLPH